MLATPSIFGLSEARLRTFTGFRPFFSGRRCLQKAPLCETYEKPWENQCFWVLSGRHGVLSAPSLGGVGTARGRPRGSQRGAWRLHLRLEWALGGFWGHLGPIFAPFRHPFGAFFVLSVFVSSRFACSRFALYVSENPQKIFVISIRVNVRENGRAAAWEIVRRILGRMFGTARKHAVGRRLGRLFGECFANTLENVRETAWRKTAGICPSKASLIGLLWFLGVACNVDHMI